MSPTTSPCAQAGAGIPAENDGKITRKVTDESIAEIYKEIIASFVWLCINVMNLLNIGSVLRYIYIFIDNNSIETVGGGV